MAGKKRRKLQERSEAQAAEQSPLQPVQSPRDRTLVRIIAIGLVLLTLAVYWRVLGNGFVNIDDDEYVTSNAHVLHGVTAKAVAWSLTAVHSSNWHPLTWMSHMLDWQLYRLNPVGHHATNLLFHILNVLLLFLLLNWMTGRVWRSAFVAALFAVHPLHVESVAWVAERKDVLSTMFWLLTMLAYYWYTLKPEIKRYALVCILFALGLMAKPMLVTLPIVLILMDYWPLGRAETFDTATIRRLVVEKLPLFALTALSCVVTFLAQRKGGAVGSLERFPFSVRVENALVSYIAYLGKMIWPAKLAVLYPFPSNVPALAVIGAITALIVITVVAIRNERARPYLAMGWLWYLVTLIPVIGIVQVGNQAMADRYTYVPLIGIFIAIAWALPELLSDKSSVGRVAFVGLASVSLVVMSFLTFVQVGYWRNSITLFRHTLASTSYSNYIAHGSLAAGLLAVGKMDEAVKEARITVELAPHAARPHDKLGAMLAMQGKISEGMEQCKKALELDPKLSDAHYDLGAMLHKSGDIAGAIKEYEEALRLNPEDPDAAEMLEVARSSGGGAASVPDLLGAVEKNPGDYQAHYRLGVGYEKEEQPDKAYEEYLKAIRLKPSFAPAHNNLGLLLGKQGRLDEAIVEFRRTLQLNPKSADTLCNMAVALNMQGKPDEAMQALQKAVLITPENAGAHANLAILYYTKQDYAAAWREVKLCRQYGGSPGESFIANLSAKMPEPL
jgi:protein O-mannosyl-transferase